jgi:hypothetical protein
MSMTLEEFKAGDLHIALNAAANDAVRLDWTGRSSHRDPARILAAFFGDALYRASPSGIIEMHFEKLEHFNSSTISALIGFLRAARRAGIQLRLVFDPGLKWQQLSFEALRVFETPDGLFQLQPVGLLRQLRP